MKILFLPFLQIPTGHHTVADALIRSMEKRILNITCKKVDFFSYAGKMLEKAFRLTYLTWIDHSPQTFVWLYRNFVYPTKSTKHFNWYEIMFLDKMKELLDEERPDLIVCTQAFPSFLLSRLTYSGILTPPVINVYTDFFVNRLWGIDGIDFHFVPDAFIKYQLINEHSVNPDRIFITGIPIDECFETPSSSLKSIPYHILISGGNGGLGDIQSLISSLPSDSKYSFSLLCGNNKKLYKDILSSKVNNVKPLNYITSREMMNALYSKADAIITKPGGVTLSEALHKRLPIFIHSSLPGQEDINKEYLSNRKLVYPLDMNRSLSEQLDSFFESRQEKLIWEQRVNDYISQFECPAWKKLLELTVLIGVKPKHYPEVAAYTGSTS